MEAVQSVGDQLRLWRRRRRLSQLDLALEAEVSARHLSFVETGRARPSRDMVMRLAESLGLPLRARNALLVAAGFAPPFAERRWDDAELAAAREAVQLILDAHAPFPALAIDRHWNMVAMNRMVPLLMAGVAPRLAEPPVNVLRLSLHPEGLAPRIEALGEWKRHILERLRAQVAASLDPVLQSLADELEAYPAPAPPAPPPAPSPIATLTIATDAGPLRFFSTTTVFGTPVEVTLSEIAIESFFPADPATAEKLRSLG